jgi:hypothetical protein
VDAPPVFIKLGLQHSLMAKRIVLEQVARELKVVDAKSIVSLYKCLSTPSEPVMTVLDGVHSEPLVEQCNFSSSMDTLVSDFVIVDPEEQETSKSCELLICVPEHILYFVMDTIYFKLSICL